MQQKVKGVQFQVESIFPVTLMAQRFPIPLPDEQQLHMVFEAQIAVPSQTQCQVMLTAKVGFDENPPFSIIVTYIGIFTLPEADEGMITELVATENEALVGELIPYIREAIMELSVRLRLAPVVIPVIRASDIIASPASSPPIETSSSIPEVPPKRPRRKKSQLAE